MNKKALITGITGQDGAYLAKFLLDKGYEVYGTYRRLSTPNFWRLQYLDIFSQVNLISADLVDSASVINAIRTAEPEEVYHLAAQSFVGVSYEQPVAVGEITGLGVTRVLEAVRDVDPDIRYYQASSSEMFGNSNSDIQDENTPFEPASPYATAKLYGYWVTRIYREAYGLFACNGILFNHESPLRGLEFVTRKICNAVGRISAGVDTELHLGNLDAARDWGYAPEYVESMWMMLQQDGPDDYVVATGETHTVRETVELAFGIAGLKWEEHVKEDKRLRRPLDVGLLRGDSAKAEEKLGWKPKVLFRDLVELMVKEDIDRWKRWQKGERFPWDALNYPHDRKVISNRNQFL